MHGGTRTFPPLLLLQSSLLPSSGAVILVFEELTEHSVMDININPLHPSVPKAQSYVASPWKQQDRTFSQLLVMAIKQSHEGRERVVWCESLLSLLKNVELWKCLTWLFDIWSMCFFFIFHLILPSPAFSLLLLWFCLSVGIGALELEGDPHQSALSRLSHTTSLKRGGSLRTPRPSGNCHSYIYKWPCTFGVL